MGHEWLHRDPLSHVRSLASASCCCQPCLGVNAEAAAILFLVRFERHHRQDIQSAAFRATDQGTVFKDIHLAQREGGGMCIQAGGEPNV